MLLNKMPKVLRAALFIFLLQGTALNASETYAKRSTGQYRQRTSSQNQNQVEEKRDYFAPLTEQEKTDIRYLINTLANNSAFNLLFHKRALNQAGNRTGHVHPLKFFLFVFTDNQLKQSVKRINGTPWKRFVKGMAGSFSISARRNNMKQEYVDDFSEKVGVSEQIIEPLVQNQNWAALINTVRDQLR